MHLAMTVVLWLGAVLLAASLVSAAIAAAWGWRTHFRKDRS